MIEEIVNAVKTDPIHIVGSIETVDNWGREEVHDTQETFKILIDSDYWTDDITFLGPRDERYLIDDLVGKVVTCGPVTFAVHE
jgi:hypothetical protein